jgi:hypothetical protein
MELTMREKRVTQPEIRDLTTDELTAVAGGEVFAAWFHAPGCDMYWIGDTGTNKVYFMTNSY